jgi:probable HAF family extracellular repeat protein
MNTLRQLRNFWIPWVTTIVLACFNNAGAQARYKVTDLGAEGNVNLGCAMSLNNEGWTEIMAQSVQPGEVDNIFGKLLSGRALIDADGFKLDLGSLGGPNTSMNWGRINDSGQIVGFSETNVPDPNGEDVCGFGTHRTCQPFLWQFFHISALPLLGGNNGEASSINNRGQIAGFAETSTVDSGCPPNLIRTPVLWKNGKVLQVLPTLGTDPDGVAFAINDQGQAAGNSGNCSGTVLHAVSWKNNTVSQLPDFQTGAGVLNMNNQGQIVGTVGTADNITQTGALWQNGALTPLALLPGDFGGIASGINSKGQVVGSNWDVNFNWAHGYIWQNNVTTDLNTLIPASANLCVTMANQINDRGQISGMAIVLSGPDAGNIHAFLATPAHQSMGKSVADVAPTCPNISLPVNVGKQLLPRFGLLHSGR